MAIALARMCNHVAVHLRKGEVVTGPRMCGEPGPCAFFGRNGGTCTMSIVRKKICNTCPCVVSNIEASSGHAQARKHAP